MKVIVRYTNGVIPEEYPSAQAATRYLLACYPGGVIYDAGGFAVGKDTPDDAYDVRNGRVALVWRTPDESYKDDGANAVAEITIA